jgi:hypothetical protein
MPRNNDCKCYIEEMEDLNEVRAEFKSLCDKNEMQDDDEYNLDEILDLHLQVVKSQKYLHDRMTMYRDFPTNFNDDLVAIYNEDNPPAIADGATIYQTTTIPWLTESEFQQKNRMTRQSFDTLLGMIKDHPAFTEHNNVGRPQAPPENQLMVLHGRTKKSVNKFQQESNNAIYFLIVQDL